MNTSLELSTRSAALESDLFSQDACLEVPDTRGTNVLEGVLHAGMEIRKEFMYRPSVPYVSFKWYRGDAKVIENAM